MIIDDEDNQSPFSIPTPPPKKKQRRQQNSVESFTTSIIDAIDKIAEPPSRPTAELFLLSIAPRLEALDKFKRSQFEIEVMQLLQKMEFNLDY